MRRRNTNSCNYILHLSGQLGFILVGGKSYDVQKKRPISVR